jgi:hypothetical protein
VVYLLVAFAVDAKEPSPNVQKELELVLPAGATKETSNGAHPMVGLVAVCPFAAVATIQAATNNKDRILMTISKISVKCSLNLLTESKKNQIAKKIRF